MICIWNDVTRGRKLLFKIRYCSDFQRNQSIGTMHKLTISIHCAVHCVLEWFSVCEKKRQRKGEMKSSTALSHIMTTLEWKTNRSRDRETERGDLDIPSNNSSRIKYENSLILARFKPLFSANSLHSYHFISFSNIFFLPAFCWLQIIILSFIIGCNDVEFPGNAANDELFTGTLHACSACSLFQCVVSECACVCSFFSLQNCGGKCKAWPETQPFHLKSLHLLAFEKCRKRKLIFHTMVFVQSKHLKRRCNCSL